MLFVQIPIVFYVYFRRVKNGHLSVSSLLISPHHYIIPASQHPLIQDMDYTLHIWSTVFVIIAVCEICTVRMA